MARKKDQISSVEDVRPAGFLRLDDDTLMFFAEQPPTKRWSLQDMKAQLEHAQVALKTHEDTYGPTYTDEQIKESLRSNLVKLTPDDIVVFVATMRNSGRSPDGSREQLVTEIERAEQALRMFEAYQKIGEFEPADTKGGL